MDHTKILLDENEMPKQWYNILADLPVEPPLNPATNEPMNPADLEPIFAKEL
ncbi:MAG: tryptophan synthase beta chain, partial [Methanolobus sp.]|nr:tryptophan synthase beta chain [Methanolobus sp.]